MRTLIVFVSFVFLVSCSEKKIPRVFVPSDIGVNLPFQEAEKNHKALQERFRSSPYANSVKQSPSEQKDAFIPHAKGTLPEANKAHLKVLGKRSADYRYHISHVAHGLTTAADNFSLKKTSVRIPFKQEIYKDAPPIKVLLLEDGKNLLKDKKFLSLPILISLVNLLRADKVCIANLEGICRKELPDALPESFEQLKKSGAVTFSLFQRISSDVLNLLSPEETLLIEYRILSNAEFSGNTSTKGVHPAESPFLQELTDYALDHYYSKFKNNPKASMADFINKFQISDCDMTALAEIIKFSSMREQNFSLFSMYGNKPIRAQENVIIDIETANHAWNFNTRGPEMWSMDKTPYPISEGFKYSFNKELLDAAKAKIDKLDSFEKFNAWEIFSPVEVEPGSLLQNQKLLEEEFEKEKQKFLQNFVSTTYKKNRDIDWINKTEYKNVKQGQLLQLQNTPRYKIQFSVGQLLLQEPRNREDSPWQSSTFGNFDSPINQKFVGLNMARVSKDKKFKFQILSISNEGLTGHDFSEITQEQVNSNIEIYKKTFKARPYLTKEDGTASRLEQSNGQIYINSHQCIYEGKYPTSEGIIEFWRSRGCRVNPIFSTTIEFAVSLE